MEAINDNIFDPLVWAKDTTSLFSGLVHYMESVDFIAMACWLFVPAAILFIMPQLITVLLYISLFIFQYFKLRSRFVAWYTGKKPIDFWEKARNITNRMWDSHARFMHSYDVIGLENIPDKGPALIICYHGAFPIDMYYLIARVCLKKNRIVRSVADKFLFSMPGYPVIAKAFGITAGTVDTCIDILKGGDLLQISPGGVYEAQFGDNTYKMLWKDRKGFAKVALGAQVPVIPMFTENLREAYRQVGIFPGLAIKLYARFKIPVRPVYGGFPVKLRTYLGKPIKCDPKMTPDELKAKVMAGIDELIKREQRLPGSIAYGLADRVFDIKQRKKYMKMD